MFLRGDGKAWSMLFVLIVSSSAIEVFPAIDYLDHGYNIVRGSPLGVGVDRGWALGRIFDVACKTCFSEARQFDQYSEPDGVTIQDSSSCTYEPISSEVTDTSSYQEASSKVISVQSAIHDVPILKKIKYSGNAQFKTVKEGSVTNDDVFLFSRATCVAYTMERSLEPEGLHFSPEFIKAVEELPSVFSPDKQETLFQFIERFGTHFPVQVGLGGEATTYQRFNQTSYRNLVDRRVELYGSAHAGASLLFLLHFGVHISADAKVDIKTVHEFSKQVSENSTKCTPLCPPATSSADDPSSWLKLLRAPNASPEPVSVSTESVLSLLSKVLAGLKSGKNLALGRVTAPELSDKISVLSQFLGQGEESMYCAMVPGCEIGVAMPHWSSEREQLITPSFGAATVQVDEDVYNIGGFVAGAAAGSQVTVTTMNAVIRLSYHTLLLRLLPCATVHTMQRTFPFVSPLYHLSLTHTPAPPPTPTPTTTHVHTHAPIVATHR
jgi:hypothetical protein